MDLLNRTFPIGIILLIIILGCNKEDELPKDIPQISVNGFINGDRWYPEVITYLPRDTDFVATFGFEIYTPDRFLRQSLALVGNWRAFSQGRIPLKNISANQDYDNNVYTLFTFSVDDGTTSASYMLDHSYPNHFDLTYNNTDFDVYGGSLDAKFVPSASSQSNVALFGHPDSLVIKMEFIARY